MTDDGQIPASQPSRRAVLAGLAGVLGGAAVGTVATAGAIGAREPTVDARPDRRPVDAGVPASGAHQAGIHLPSTPQSHTFVVSADLVDATDRTFLAPLGAEILALTDSSGFDPEITPAGPGNLTVTVGIGPRVVSSLDPTLPGAAELPIFDRDGELSEADRGGDLLLSICSDEPSVLPRVARHLLTVGRATARWSQRGFRGPGDGTVVRNPLGFHDGIIVPRTPQELEEAVWIAAGAAARGCVAVVRRIRLDVDAFDAEPLARREQMIGRHLDTGAPLSGGTQDDEVNLALKTPDGYYLTPPDAHVRATHPSFTGSGLMLRRGYSFDNGGDDVGLLFVAFQQELDTFVNTQRRIDALDALAPYMAPTASASFLILPGYSASSPLGSTLAPPAAAG